jgi:hypothetical protein
MEVLRLRMGRVGVGRRDGRDERSERLSTRGEDGKEGKERGEERKLAGEIGEEVGQTGGEETPEKERGPESVSFTCGQPLPRGGRGEGKKKERKGRDALFALARRREVDVFGRGLDGIKDFGSFLPDEMASDGVEISSEVDTCIEKGGELGNLG